ncbi:MAG: hypothetical protein WC791_01730 [Candidatus Paceibacterota bacterium]
MKKNKPLLGTLIFVLLFSLLSVVILGNQKQQLKSVVAKGVIYIYKNQLPTGEIQSSFCINTKILKSCLPDESFFMTASSLYSLDKISERYTNDYLDLVREKSIDFFIKNRPTNNIWRFFPKDSVTPDIDDTALISYLLEKHGYGISDNHKIINKNVNDSGIYYTWFKENGARNDTDSVVNVNVALYLNNNITSSKICDYTSRLIKEGQESNSHYWYIDDYDLYYAMARAYNEGVDCFGNEKELIIQKIVGSQKKTGIIGDNEFTTALALNALIDFGYQNKDFYNKSFDYLFRTQQNDGGWSLGDFYKGDTLKGGSRSYTTAVALEAITSYYYK